MTRVVLVGAPRSGASLLTQLLADGGIESEWAPPNSLEVASIAEDDAEARFVLVVRRPLLTISSSMVAWQSGRFVSQRGLAGWWGDAWSFPLVDGWERLIGAPLATVCATQWAAISEAALDALEGLPRDRWTVASFEELLDEPETELRRIAADLGLQWNGEVPNPIPPTSTCVTPPDSGAWRVNSSEVAQALELVQQTCDRLLAAVVARRPEFVWHDLESAPIEATRTTKPSQGTPFASAHTPSVAELLQKVGVTLAISTYKSGHLILARAADMVVDTDFTDLPRPMGIAVSGTRLAVGTADAVLVFTGNPGLGALVPSQRLVDVAYAPRSVIFTGDISIHDMAYGSDGVLYFVNTKFSCLCRQDIDYSFVPVWRPSWVSGLAGEDRCHLNGLAMVDGRAKYVTALAETDTAHGWRDLKGIAGVIVDVDTNDVIARGLAMPHSPRWHDGRLWVLESGKGALCTVDVRTGAVTTVATLPGFTRGLAFIGRYALVGLSQVRESVFTSLPITETATERNCGVWVVNTESGEVVGFLKFDGLVQEIFEVAVVPAAWPVVLDAGDLTQGAYVLPDAALRDVVG
ncbi:unannotated protein [freshwater metagenome]|uniref:Unannotated protein n=1 Tax=freshwater metagenome TaxID=449393 RepID=A0A6J7P535_9ZZZZ